MPSLLPLEVGSNSPSMIDLLVGPDRRLNRRTLLRFGLSAATLGALGGSVSAAPGAASGKSGSASRPVACILMFLDGGPSQMETWDPKPGTSNGGETKAISTSVSGIKIAEYWPKMAQVMQDVALIRSITSKEGEHARAKYQMHTGRRPTGALKFPNLGSVMSEVKGDKHAELPNFVSVRGDTTGAGFLDVRNAPFVVQRPGQLPENVKLLVSPERLSKRLDLVRMQDTDYARVGAKALADEHQGLYAQAARLVQTPKLSAFDLSSESEKTREAYGDTSVGESLLLARRLVEVGVPFVEVRDGGWDNHQDIYKTLPKNAGSVDRGLAALIADLRTRGMLERTLVICMGDFGRTPKVNPRGGRDHWPRNFSVALGGGGIRGGQVIGKTDDKGQEIASNPVTIPDLFQSLCRVLQIDPNYEMQTPQGRPIKIVDGGQPVKALFG